MSVSGNLGDVPEQRFRRPRPGEEVESPTLPLPPPKERGELEALLLAVATTPTSDRQLIVDTVDAFDNRERVASLLNDALLELPVHDVGRHLIVLSLTGQLRHPSSVDPLERFVWLDDARLLPPDSHAGTPSGLACHFEPFGALQARAAEMLVWVTRGDYREGIGRILSEHPSTQVRVATIDACAYVADDDPGAIEQLRQLAQAEDQWAVGLPRRARDGEGNFDADAFHAAIARHQSVYGSTPELPVRSDRTTGDDDVC